MIYKPKDVIPYIRDIIIRYAADKHVVCAYRFKGRIVQILGCI